MIFQSKKLIEDQRRRIENQERYIKNQENEIKRLEAQVRREQGYTNFVKDRIAILEKQVQAFQNGTSYDVNPNHPLVRMPAFVEAVRKALTAHEEGKGKITAEETLFLLKIYLIDIIGSEPTLTGSQAEEFKRSMGDVFADFDKLKSYMRGRR